MRAMPGQLSGRLASCAALAVAVAVTLGAATPARAQDYFGAAAEPMTFEVDRPRTRQAKVLIASLFGGAVVFAGAGLLFHLHARGQADEVATRTDHHTGKIYTDELDATRRDAVRSGRLAAAGYAIGGGFLIGTFVAYLLTDPGTETIRVGDEEAPAPPPPSGAPQATGGARIDIAPAPGGGLVGATWSF
jgi:hypothetical protein